MSLLRHKFLVGLVLSVLYAAPGLAQSVYTVDNVTVDATDVTAAAARDVALASGQLEAAHRLLRRLTPVSHHALLPELGPERVTRLIASMEIQSEKRSTTRYLANLTFNFKKDDVRRLLRNLNIPFSETMSKPVLVLPIYEAAGATNLWDEPNLWRDAWRGIDPMDRFVPLIVASGDLTDVGLISVDQAVANDPERIAAIARRYGVDDVVLVHAVLVQDLAARIPRLTVTVQRIGPTVDSTAIESFSGVSRQAVAALLTNSAQAIAQSIEESWKQATRLEFTVRGRLSVRVPLADLREWIDIRARLKDAAAIQSIEIREMTRSYVQIVVHHFGSSKALSVALAQRNLVLAQDDEFWVIYLTGKEN
jgi:hypothetical protein